MFLLPLLPCVLVVYPGGCLERVAGLQGVSQCAIYCHGSFVIPCWDEDVGGSAPISRTHLFACCLACPMYQPHQAVLADHVPSHNVVFGATDTVVAEDIHWFGAPWAWGACHLSVDEG